MSESTSIQETLKRIGFINTAAWLVTGDQYIYYVDEINTFDYEMEDNMCKVICRPGGTAIGGGTDPGVNVSARYEKNIKLAIYYTKHQERVLRAIKIGSITLVNIFKLINQREIEQNNTNPELPQKIVSKD